MERHLKKIRVVMMAFFAICLVGLGITVLAIQPRDGQGIIADGSNALNLRGDGGGLNTEALFVPQVTDEATQTVSILLYHHIGDDEDNRDVIDAQTFEAQMVELQENGYNTVFFEDLINYVEKGWALPENAICITFDDGYLSNYEVAYPILKKYNMKATIFAIGSFVGSDTYKETGIEIIPHFTYTQAREMSDSGLISVQSHSYDMHQMTDGEGDAACRKNALKLSSETEGEYIEVLKADYERSKLEIENATNKEVNVYAYPKGEYDSLAGSVLESVGVKSTVIIREGKNILEKGNSESLYKLKRFYMSKSVSMEDLLEKIKVEKAAKPEKDDGQSNVHDSEYYDSEYYEYTEDSENNDDNYSDDSGSNNQDNDNDSDNDDDSE